MTISSSLYQQLGWMSTLPKQDGDDKGEISSRQRLRSEKGFFFSIEFSTTGCFFQLSFRQLELSWGAWVLIEVLRRTQSSIINYFGFVFAFVFVFVFVFVSVYVYVFAYMYLHFLYIYLRSDWSLQVHPEVRSIKPSASSQTGTPRESESGVNSPNWWCAVFGICVCTQFFVFCLFS